MQIIGVQFDIAWEDKAANHARVRALVAEARALPGALIVLPEMFATGFSMNVAGIAERHDGPTHRFLAELAEEHQAFVMGGLVTKASDGRGRNEAVVFGPQGRELARYCKLQPFTLGGEARHYEAGDDGVLFDWHEFRVAPFICYDLRFPELFRSAVRKGAHLMTVIASWPEARAAHWLSLLVARAIENQCYVVGVNRIGSDPRLTYQGGSLIVSPSGEILATAGEGEHALVADVELEPLLEFRRRLPFLDDIRPEFLGR